MDKISSLKQENFWAKLRIDFISYVNDKVYMLSLIITALGSYGFLITHYSISVDDLEWNRYYYGELIAQGRITATIFHRFFDLTDNFIWIQDFWGMVFLCIGVILLCIVFDRVSQSSCRTAKIIFSCLFVSYPLHSEIFVYNGCFIAIGVGLTFIALALLSMIYYQHFKKLRFIILATAFILPVASWYESVFVIYISAVFGILLIEQIDDKSKSVNMSKLIRKGISYACPFLVTVVLENIASNLIRLLLKIKPSVNAQNQIVFIERKLSLADVGFYCGYAFNELIKSFFNYFPVRIFVFSILIIFCIVIIEAFRLKKLGIILCGVGLVLSNFIIWILTSGIIHYRTCTSFAFMVAFTAFIILYNCNCFTERKRKITSIVIPLLCTLLIFAQINSINYYFTNDYLRYEYEKRILEDIGTELENNYDLSKNVIFVGEPEMSQNVKTRTEKDYNTIVYKALIHVPLINRQIRLIIPDSNVKVKIQQTNCQSYIKWAVEAFNQESMIKFLRFIGFDNIKSGSEDEIEDAKKNSEEMPSWPADGSIYDNGDYIIVKF